MNASDFLTKHINLAWKDAKSFLLEVYSQQLENTPYTRYPTYRRLTHHEARERLNSLNLSEKHYEILSGLSVASCIMICER